MSRWVKLLFLVGAALISVFLTIISEACSIGRSSSVSPGTFVARRLFSTYHHDLGRFSTTAFWIDWVLFFAVFLTCLAIVSKLRRWNEVD